MGFCRISQKKHHTARARQLARITPPWQWKAFRKTAKSLFLACSPR